MKKVNDQIILSAGDLSNYISCSHVSALDLGVAEGLLAQPQYRDPLLDLLQQRGMEFEQEYLQQMRSEGLSIAEPVAEFLNIEDTIAAMQAGVGLIYQGALKSEPWNGRFDFLQRVEKPSRLGSWSYEVIDSKLATETKAGTILQLCLYSEMLSEIQGELPEYMHVITPLDGFTRQSYRLADYLAYHRMVKRNLQLQVSLGIGGQTSYPHPSDHCEICRWWQKCDRQRRDDDHLSLVAGLSNVQRVELNRHQVDTLEELAGLPLPLAFRPSKGSVRTFEKLREQARLQYESRDTNHPLFELLGLEPGRGLYSLPEPSAGDVFFDFEGDPFIGSNGMEYLFGWVFNNDSEKDYQRSWVFTAAAEKAAFEAFMDMLMERRKVFPDLHIYHYTSYEPSAFKRLAGKYGTRESELDELLRAGVFVDLYHITRQTVIAGIERYSLKELEIFHAFGRKMELREAARQLRTAERLLERKDFRIPPETIAAIEAYNMEDCLSTKSLRSWLEELRLKAVESGEGITRPEARNGQPGEELTALQLQIAELYQRLAGDISIERESRTDEEQGRWLLANMLDWYRREKKATWWEYFRLCELPEEELIEEKSALGGLVFTGIRRPEKKSFIDRYSFPAQESDIRKGDKLKSTGGEGFGEVFAIDLLNCTVDIKKGPKIEAIHPVSVFKHDILPDEVKGEAIFRIASWAADHGIDAEGAYRAGRDLLLGFGPRSASLPVETANAQVRAVEWVQQLENGVLPIQGPPGAGKSHTAAEMILALVQSGKKVGITALSHKVISGLLEKVARSAAEKGFALQCIQKGDSSAADPRPGIRDAKNNGEILAALQAGTAMVAAGTSWLWCREEFAEAVDVLFVDEAGQFSLIDTVAVSQAGKSMVLLGDPQQLKQPQKGSHPEGTEVSALEHILGEHKTIQPEQGIFLNETWRLHPEICSFTSELFYEGLLYPVAGLENQLLSGDTKFIGAGLWFEPVAHQGNQSSSIQEANHIALIVNQLVNGSVMWTDKEGRQRVLGINDIMVIAPYNAQVFQLRSVLPAGCAVGTVDKFQGQEAPVVIFSMTTSSPAEAPRGMEFLYSANRLNVAVSRARTACILVASPELFKPECKSPQQMKLANAFCRYLEVKN